MSDTYLGAKHWLGFSPQVMEGVAEAAVTTFLATTSITMEPNQKPVARKASLGTGVKLPSRKGTMSPDGKSPGVEVLASQPEPWVWAMGGHTTTQPAPPTDPTVFQHVIFDSGESVRLTGEANRVFTKTRQNDVIINKITLKCQVGEIATIDIEWFALGHEDAVTITSVPAFPDDVLVATAVKVTLGGGVELRVNEFEVSWDGKHKASAVLEDALGGPKFIRRESAPDVTGTLKFVDFPADQYLLLQNAGVFSVEVELFGELISTIYRNSLAIDLPACQYTGGLDAPITEAIITGDANFQAFYDTVTAKQITVTAVNTRTTINA